jgi:hypothetical protein
MNYEKYCGGEVRRNEILSKFTGEIFNCVRPNLV